MKPTTMKELKWVDNCRFNQYEVRRYIAYHKNNADREEGLAFLWYEGSRVANVKVPLVVPFTPEDRYIVEPSAKGLRTPKGCAGFMQWFAWFKDVEPEDCEKFLHYIFRNTKMPVSGLSAYIRDIVQEEQQ